MQQRCYLADDVLFLPGEPPVREGDAEQQLDDRRLVLLREAPVHQPGELVERDRLGGPPAGYRDDLGRLFRRQCEGRFEAPDDLLLLALVHVVIGRRNFDKQHRGRDLDVPR